MLNILSNSHLLLNNIILVPLYHTITIRKKQLLIPNHLLYHLTIISQYNNTDDS